MPNLNHCAVLSFNYISSLMDFNTPILVNGLACLSLLNGLKTETLLNWFLLDERSIDVKKKRF